MITTHFPRIVEAESNFERAGNLQLQARRAGWQQQQSGAVSPSRCSWNMWRSAVSASACLVHVRKHQTRKSRRTYGCRGEKALAAVADADLVMNRWLQRSFWRHGRGEKASPSTLACGKEMREKISFVASDTIRQIKNA